MDLMSLSATSVLHGATWCNNPLQRLPVLPQCYTPSLPPKRKKESGIFSCNPLGGNGFRDLKIGNFAGIGGKTAGIFGATSTCKIPTFPGIPGRFPLFSRFSDAVIDCAAVDLPEKFPIPAGV